MSAPMVRQWRLAALLGAAVVATACASMNVSSYASRDLEVRRYHTYAWGPADTQSTGDPRLDNNEFFDARVRQAVERELAARGFEKSTTATPDMLIHYHASVTQQIDTKTLDRDYAACQDGDCAPMVYDAGTLFVDLLDPRTRTLIWRGWAEGSVEGTIDDQAWLDARIDEAISRILRRLPRL